MQRSHDTREKKVTSFRLTVEGRDLLAAVGRYEGLNLTEAFEVTIREAARRRGLLENGRSVYREEEPRERGLLESHSWQKEGTAL